MPDHPFAVVEQPTEEVSLEQLAIELLENGVEPTVIARSWGLDPDYINSLPAKRSSRIMDESEISQGILKLMTMSLEEARKILIEGTPTVKTRFIYSLISIYIKNFSSQAPKEMEELRAEFLDLIQQTGKSAPNNA